MKIIGEGHDGLILTATREEIYNICNRGLQHCPYEVGDTVPVPKLQERVEHLREVSS
jgi:hypothetical protein